MNSQNSKTSHIYLLLNLIHNIGYQEVKRKLHYRILELTIHEKNIKFSYRNNKFEISAPRWNDKSELLDGLYAISDIQDYFE